MLKSMTIVEMAEGWTPSALGLPDTYVLVAKDQPKLAVFSFPGTLLDCRVVVDACRAPAAWIHGTDCSMTKAVRASIDRGDGAPLVPECTRRARGGSFRTMPLPR
jgi:hypothetical protein